MYLSSALPDGAGTLAARLICILAVWALGLPLWADEQPVKAETAQRVESLVYQLGAASFEERERAMQKLIATGTAALPRLRSALKELDLEIARRAEKCIEAIEINDKVAELVADLSRSGPKLRAEAADRLMDMRSRAQPAVPALIKLLDDDDLHVRIRATVALGNIGPGAKAAIPRLRQLLNDTHADTELRCCAAKYLAMIGPDAECAVPDLLRLLRGGEPPLRAWAAFGLAVLGKNHPDVIPILIEALGDKNALVQARAAEALGEIAKEPARCVPALRQALKKAKGHQGELDPRASLLFALQMFGRIDKEAIRETIPDIYELAADENVGLPVRALAVRALAQMGREAKDKLEDLAKGKKPLVSMMARDELQRLGDR